MRRDDYKISWRDRRSQGRKLKVNAQCSMFNVQTGSSFKQCPSGEKERFNSSSLRLEQNFEKPVKDKSHLVINRVFSISHRQ
jgi:hypothetical protein